MCRCIRRRVMGIPPVAGLGAARRVEAGGVAVRRGVAESREAGWL